MLKSKSILAEKSPDDGLRVSIMSRHTLNDGITQDERLTPDRFDEHMPEFAAPGWAVGGYYRGELSRNEYVNHYRAHVETQREKVRALIIEALTKDITVMCIEDSPELCHRKIFIEYCQELADVLSLPLQTKIE
ncbi:DUF488 family protein [Patescibacteria group bacterium]|nr:DUF488 family protein [Patescibacteria group bacterium]